MYIYIYICIYTHTCIYIHILIYVINDFTMNDFIINDFMYGYTNGSLTLNTYIKTLRTRCSHTCHGFCFYIYIKTVHRTPPTEPTPTPTPHF